jgi:N-methylhydantoinase B
MVSLITGGGGGWGEPAERAPERVLRAVLNEYVTPEVAREVYKVEIDTEKMEVDPEATRKLRGNK